MTRRPLKIVVFEREVQFRSQVAIAQARNGFYPNENCFAHVSDGMVDQELGHLHGCIFEVAISNEIGVQLRSRGLRSLRCKTLPCRTFSSQLEARMERKFPRTENNADRHLWSHPKCRFPFQQFRSIHTCMTYVLGNWYLVRWVVQLWSSVECDLHSADAQQTGKKTLHKGGRKITANKTKGKKPQLALLLASQGNELGAFAASSTISLSISIKQHFRWFGEPVGRSDVQLTCAKEATTTPFASTGACMSFALFIWG